jgi:IS1 family transposase
VIAYEIGEGIETAIRLYKKVKKYRRNIIKICTDANSCYEQAFKQIGVKETHLITKKETHLIESFNSSIRDNLARFNRKSKRFSKTIEMLKVTLDLFFREKMFSKVSG